MSNETKRDVLVNAVDALADAQASSDNNVGLGHQDADLFMAEYDAALPDDLPVIPEKVGDAITYAKANGISIGDVFWRCGEGGMFDCDEVESWINYHGDTFARAWVLGVWRVDETGEIVKLEASK